MTTTPKPSDAAFGQAYLRVMSRDGKWLCKADAYEFAAEVEKTARAIDAEPPQGEQSSAERALAKEGVFKGAHGLRGLAEAKEFWDQQPYGTRLYYGPSITDYLHHSVLKSAVRILDSRRAQPAQGVPVDVAMIRRVIHELRTYNPIADHYNGKHIHPTWAKELEAAIAASPAPAAVPEGMVLVPREPTESMLREFWHVCNGESTVAPMLLTKRQLARARKAYWRLLAAEPPQEGS